jgi:hypothetical protein
MDYEDNFKASLPLVMTFAAFLGIAYYNAAVVIVKTLATFKRYTGLYFWSLLVAASGIIVTSTGVILKIFEVGPLSIALTLATLGWYGMVTGQSLVLYSRLHLAEPTRKRLRWVLTLIIVDFVIFHLGMSAVYFPANLLARPNAFWTPFQVYEKIQVTAFAMQECLLSALYINGVRKMFGLATTYQVPGVKKILKHIISINVVIIVLDLALIGTEYANLYDVQTTLKSAVYSVKLVLEFSILNRLRAMVMRNHSMHSIPTAPLEDQQSGYVLRDADAKAKKQSDEVEFCENVPRSVTVTITTDANVQNSVDNN